MAHCAKEHDAKAEEKMKAWDNMSKDQVTGLLMKTLDCIEKVVG